MLVAIALAGGALASCASLGSSQVSGNEAPQREAEPNERITAYSDLRITPSIVPGVDTYFGQSDSIVSMQRHRLLLYHYPELLQPRN